MLASVALVSCNLPSIQCGKVCGRAGRSSCEGADRVCHLIVPTLEPDVSSRLALLVSRVLVGSQPQQHSRSTSVAAKRCMMQDSVALESIERREHAPTNMSIDGRQVGLALDEQNADFQASGRKGHVQRHLPPRASRLQISSPIEQHLGPVHVPDLRRVVQRTVPVEGLRLFHSIHVRAATQQETENPLEALPCKQRDHEERPALELTLCGQAKSEERGKLSEVAAVARACHLQQHRVPQVFAQLVCGELLDFVFAVLLAPGVVSLSSKLLLYLAQPTALRPRRFETTVVWQTQLTYTLMHSINAATDSRAAEQCACLVKDLLLVSLSKLSEDAIPDCRWRQSAFQKLQLGFTIFGMGCRSQTIQRMPPRLQAVRDASLAVRLEDGAIQLAEVEVVGHRPNLVALRRAWTASPTLHVESHLPHCVGALSGSLRKCDDTAVDVDRVSIPLLEAPQVQVLQIKGCRLVEYKPIQHGAIEKTEAKPSEPLLRRLRFCLLLPVASVDTAGEAASTQLGAEGRTVGAASAQSRPRLPDSGIGSTP
eukprot:scaffold1307_cov200-Pinguiococcus_pyrenoidosus.AAC.142